MRTIHRNFSDIKRGSGFSVSSSERPADNLVRVKNTHDVHTHIANAQNNDFLNIAAQSMDNLNNSLNNFFTVIITLQFAILTLSGAIETLPAAALGTSVGVAAVAIRRLGSPEDAVKNLSDEQEEFLSEFGVENLKLAAGVSGTFQRRNEFIERAAAQRGFLRSAERELTAELDPLIEPLSKAEQRVAILLEEQQGRAKQSPELDTAKGALDKLRQEIGPLDAERQELRKQAEALDVLIGLLQELPNPEGVQGALALGGQVVVQHLQDIKAALDRCCPGGALEGREAPPLPTEKPAPPVTRGEAAALTSPAAQLEEQAAAAEQASAAYMALNTIWRQSAAGAKEAGEGAGDLAEATEGTAVASEAAAEAMARQMTEAAAERRALADAAEAGREHAAAGEAVAGTWGGAVAAAHEFAGAAAPMARAWREATGDIERTLDWMIGEGLRGNLDGVQAFAAGVLDVFRNLGRDLLRRQLVVPVRVSLLRTVGLAGAGGIAGGAAAARGGLGGLLGTAGDALSLGSLLGGESFAGAGGLLEGVGTSLGFGRTVTAPGGGAAATAPGSLFNVTLGGTLAMTAWPRPANGNVSWMYAIDFQRAA